MAVNELAELLSFANPKRQWRTLSWGFHTLWGGIDPWDHRLGSRFVGIVKIWKDFSSGDLNLPVSGRTSALAGEATLVARSLHEPQPISNQPM